MDLLHLWPITQILQKSTNWFPDAKTEEEKQEAVNMLKDGAEKGITASMNALAWAYENGWALKSKF